MTTTATKKTTSASRKPAPGKRPTTKGSRSKAAGFNREEEEAKLVKKYPKQRIKKGSLADVGEHADFGNKRTVEIYVQDPDGAQKGKTRRIATSDLHQVYFSREYMESRRRSKGTATAGKKKPAGKKAAAPAKKPAARKPIIVPKAHKPAHAEGAAESKAADVAPLDLNAE